MKKRVFCLVIILFGLCQATILDYFKVWSVKPDLLLICAVFAGLLFELKYALLFAFLAAFLKDTFTLQPLAAHIIYFPLLAFFVSFLAKKIPLETTAIRVALILFAVILVNLVKKFIQFSGENYLAFGLYLRVTILESLYTALVSPLVFKIIK